MFLSASARALRIPARQLRNDRLPGGNPRRDYGHCNCNPVCVHVTNLELWRLHWRSRPPLPGRSGGCSDNSR